MCSIQCRLIYGSQRAHNLISPLPARANKWCTEFGLSTDLGGPPTDYEIDRNAEYECFASGGFLAHGYGANVGNTTVNCAVTWVLSFPQANMTPKFVTVPVWYERPGPNDQSCENITMMIPIKAASSIDRALTPYTTAFPRCPSPSQLGIKVTQRF